MSSATVAQEDDYEFMPLHAWRILGENGEDARTTMLAEGFPGLRSEVSKNRWLEPVDGAGGFDNVAPRLQAHEGPGGLEWDPSPTYRTRYKNGTDYTNNGTTRMQGNNWFTKIPYATYDSTNDEYVVRFDANTVRYYDYSSANTYTGRYGNHNSVLKVVGGAVLVYDIDGKIYSFTESGATKRCAEISGYGGAKVTFTYASGSITVKQFDGTTEYRRFIYTLTDHGSGKRIDKIEVQHKPASTWTTFRTIEFTYHEQVTGAVGSSTGDLIGIEDEKDLTDTTKSYTRKYVFKYYTGSYNSSTNPGNPYQIEAVIEPGDVKRFEDDSPTLDIYKRSVSQLEYSGHISRSYTYHSDRRLKDLVLDDSCGCGGGSGTYSYTWESTTQPSGWDSWWHQVEIVLPTDARRYIDYNRYGQTLNDVLQEDEADSSSRQWITTYRRSTKGQLEESYSVAACFGL